MITSMLKAGALGLCAVVLSGCLAANPPTPETRTIRFTYCTNPDGRVVANPAEASRKGVRLSCYNFIAK